MSSKLIISQGALAQQQEFLPMNLQNSRVQPQYAAEINYELGISRDIRIVYNFGERPLRGWNGPRNAVDGRRVNQSHSDAFTMNMTTEGWSVRPGQSQFYSLYGASQTTVSATSGITAFMLLRMNANFVTPYRMHSADNAGWWNASIGAGDGTNPRFYGNSYQGTAVVAPVDYVLYRTYALAVTVNTSGTTFYVDGVKIGSNTNAPGNPSFERSITISGSAAFSSAFDLFLYQLWRRQLSDAEVAFISQNPYALLRGADAGTFVPFLSTPASSSTASSDLAVTYSILATEQVQSSTSASYNVIAAVQASSSAAYNVLALIQKDAAASYNIIAAIQKDLISTFNVSAAVQSSVSASYNVRALVQASTSASYNVVTGVQSSVNAAYSIVAGVQGSLAGSYNILSSTAVQSSLSATYNVSATVQSSTSATYNVRVSLQSSTSASYNVRNSLQSSLSASYNLFNSLQKDLSATFNISGSPMSSLAATYNIVTTVQSSLNGAYSTYASIQSSLSAAYNVKNEVVSSITALYVLSNSLQKDTSASYNVLGRVQKDLSATYSLLTGGGSGASAQDIFNFIVGSSGLTFEQIVSLQYDLAKIHGLVVAMPLTVTPTTRVAGDVNQNVTGDGETTTTVTRT
jgi:hypothetical protein